MKNFIFLFLTALVTSVSSMAQDDLFGTSKKEARSGFMIGVNANFDIPLADMADRFGVSYRVGPSLHYKTKSNWIIGAKTDFIFGNKIEEDSFLSNLNTNGGIISLSGFRTNTNVYQRGYAIGLQLGKIINFSKNNSDNGLLVAATLGFVQHKILITDEDGQLPQLSGDYRKGYDRLTNGVFLEPYVGYMHLSNNGLINFHIGLDALLGFTQGRRAYLFDVQKPGDEKRFDILFGVRGGWYIPIFKKKSEDYFFD